MKIFLSIGHEPKSPGACNGDWCEHQHAAEWIAIINQRLVEFGLSPVIVPVGTLKEKVSFINTNCESGDIAIELHFNSNVAASGSESLYYPKSSAGKKFAENIQEHLSAVFCPDRGVKEGYYQDGTKQRKLLYFLAKTSPVSVIIEPEFVYNKEKLDAKKIYGCEAIAWAIKEYVMET